MSDAIADWLAERVVSGDLPGAAWIVEQEARALSRGAVGWASLTSERVPATEDTPYDLASLTKPLATALVAVLLEDAGRLELEAPASGLLPELSGSPYASATLLDLGAHRAGLPAWRPLYLKAGDLAGFVQEIARTPAATAPGATLYSDLGYILLGAALERGAGSRLRRLFAELVARPLALERLGYPESEASFADAAAVERGNRYERTMAGEEGAGFAWREEIPRGQVHDQNAHTLGGAAGHAGLFGTASEVARLGREIGSGTALGLSARARRRLLEPVVGEGSRSFGFVLARDSGAARGILPDEAPGHTGFTGTSLWLEPGCQRVLVLLSNRVHPEVATRDFQEVRRGFHRLAR